MLESFESIILTVHIMICIFLVISILLQAGKGADIGATFGAGSSQTLFGPRGAATFLSKLTSGAAIMFLLTSIGLASIHKNRVSDSSSSALDGIQIEQKADDAESPDQGTQTR